MKKICIVLGTRPEIIKISPIIAELKDKGSDFFIIHTNQHYDENMDKIFFEDLKIDLPKYNLQIGSGGHGDMTGRMLIEIEKILLKEKPYIVLVQGDTNTVLAGALAASKLNMKVGHVEAGLRSYDREMPEEINRIIADQVSDFLFPPTTKAEKILIKEGFDGRKIFMVGNTIVDSINRNIKFSSNNILEKLGVSKENFSILTLHRPSNVDNKDNFISILKGLDKTKELGLSKILFLVHPRTKNKIKEFKIKLPGNLIIIDPVGYLDMLNLLKKSKVIFTDSGGIQEEACILKVPCVTIRENTERPETIDVGSNILVGTNYNRIFEGTKKMISRKGDWENPFGDGKASQKIIDIIRR